MENQELSGMEEKRMYELKIDSLRKSRDYFKKERNELNERIVNQTKSHLKEMEIASSELMFTREEITTLENELKSYKFMCWALTILGTLCFAGLYLILKVLN
jgi:hypothetical protein